MAMLLEGLKQRSHGQRGWHVKRLGRALEKVRRSTLEGVVEQRLRRDDAEDVAQSSTTDQRARMRSLDHLAAVGLGRVVEVVVIYVRAWCHQRGDALFVHPEHAGNERLLMLPEFPLLHQRFDLFV